MRATSAGRALEGITAVECPLVAIVRAPGDLDEFGAAELHRHLAAVARTGAHIVVDLRSTHSIGSPGFRVLVDHARAARGRGAWLQVACGDARIVRILEITLLDRLLPILPGRARGPDGNRAGAA
jgi:anti-anti-sigma factor